MIDPTRHLLKKETNMVNIAILVEYGRNGSGKETVVYTLVEDGDKRGGDLGANPDPGLFVREARKFIDLVRSRGNQFSVLVDKNTDQHLISLAQKAASEI